MTCKQVFHSIAYTYTHRHLPTPTHVMKMQMQIKSMDDIERGVVQTFAVGEKVHALWKNNGRRLYPGVITHINGDGTYDIQYDDGDREYSVRWQLIRKSNNQLAVASPAAAAPTPASAPAPTPQATGVQRVYEFSCGNILTVLFLILFLLALYGVIAA